MDKQKNPMLKDVILKRAEGIYKDFLDDSRKLVPEDIILKRCAELYQNLGDDSTPEEVEEANKQERFLLSKLYEINPELAERCGHKEAEKNE